MGKNKQAINTIMNSKFGVVYSRAGKGDRRKGKEKASLKRVHCQISRSSALCRKSTDLVPSTDPAIRRRNEAINTEIEEINHLSKSLDLVPLAEWGVLTRKLREMEVRRWEEYQDVN